MLRKFIPALLIVFLVGLPSFAQDCAYDPEADCGYELELQHIEWCRVDEACISINLSYSSTVPPEIGSISQLQFLELNGLELDTIPVEITNLRNLRYLDLRNNNFLSLPPEIGQLTSLEVLHLEYNQLKSLPPEIGRLTNLRELWLDGNQLTSLPPEIGQLNNLEILLLQDNLLSSLPPEIGQLNTLCALYLNDNHLQYLPVELSHLSQFAITPDCGILNVDNNPLISPPQEVIEQGTSAILAYLRNEAWWHLQKMIAGGASFTGILAAAILALRWKNWRGKIKRKNA